MLNVKNKAESRGAGRGLLARLRANQSGNTTIISAFALVPLMGFVGGGVDMGRIYAVHTRLQHACDAAVLVGRKEMMGSNFSTSDEDAADTFFRNNFVDSKFGTTESSIDFAVDGQSGLEAVAKAKVPMAIMQIFGQEDAPVEVQCKAELSLSNTDIMFVLDTTGSMALTNAGDPADRMTGMRDAVSNFYDQVEGAKSGNTQIRYGFVPYSKTVNVGGLLNANWIADDWEYQSRKPGKVENYGSAGGDATTHYSYEDYTYPGTAHPSPTVTNMPLESCSAPAGTFNSSYSLLWQTDTPWAGPPAGTQTKRRYLITYSGIRHDLDESATSCKVYSYDFTGYKVEYTEVGTPGITGAYSGTHHYYNYEQIKFNTSALTVGGSLKAMTGQDHTEQDHVWNGCIEERATVHADSYDPIPAAAFDMQIDLVPNGNKKTQWGPWLPSLIWSRPHIDSWSPEKYESHYGTQNYGTHNGGAYASCPSPSRKLGLITSTELDTYLASLVPTGATHHDIGMVWGARLLSPTGLFASENASAPNGGAITRHMIFMTDGETDTTIIDYDAYGVNIVDRRRKKDKDFSPTKAEADEEVEKRFAALCTEVKRRNVTIWVITFGIQMTDLLSTCASPGKSFQAVNTAELNAAFGSIASSISRLRLTD